MRKMSKRFINLPVSILREKMSQNLTGQGTQSSGTEEKMRKVYERLHNLSVEKQLGIELYADGRRVVMNEIVPESAGAGLLEVVMGYKLIAYVVPSTTFEEFLSQVKNQ